MTGKHEGRVRTSFGFKKKEGKGASLYDGEDTPPSRPPPQDRKGPRPCLTHLNTVWTRRQTVRLFDCEVVRARQTSSQGSLATFP